MPTLLPMPQWHTRPPSSRPSLCTIACHTCPVALLGKPLSMQPAEACLTSTLDCITSALLPQHLPRQHRLPPWNPAPPHLSLTSLSLGAELRCEGWWILACLTQLRGTLPCSGLWPLAVPPVRHHLQLPIDEPQIVFDDLAACMESIFSF